MSRYRRKQPTRIKDMIAVQFHQTVLFLQPYSCCWSRRFSGPVQIVQKRLFFLFE